MNEFYNYCQDADSGFLKNVNTALSEAFDLKNDFLSELYSEFTANFKGKSRQFIGVEKSNCIPKTSDLRFLNAYKEYIVGIDLPTLIKPKSFSTGKLVFIVGEDPLRTRDEDTENIIFGTPYATHLEKCVDSNGKRFYPPRHYWQLSELLLREAYSLYFTDTNKVWVKNKESNFKEKLPVDLKENFAKSLNREISLMSPEFIISFGSKARKAVASMISNEVLHMSFPHPASWGNKPWIKHGMEMSDNKVNYMFKKIIERDSVR